VSRNLQTAAQVFNSVEVQFGSVNTEAASVAAVAAGVGLCIAPFQITGQGNLCEGSARSSQNCQCNESLA
jgi:hypothetical protein